MDSTGKMVIPSMSDKDAGAIRRWVRTTLVPAILPDTLSSWGLREAREAKGRALRLLTVKERLALGFPVEKLSQAIMAKIRGTLMFWLDKEVDYWEKTVLYRTKADIDKEIELERSKILSDLDSEFSVTTPSSGEAFVKMAQEVAADLGVDPTDRQFTRDLQALVKARNVEEHTPEPMTSRFWRFLTTDIGKLVANYKVNTDRRLQEQALRTVIKNTVLLMYPSSPPFGYVPLTHKT